MKVELFYAPGCNACSSTSEELRAAALRAIEDLEWREINAAENVDRAVELGVLTLPSIAIDGVLVFTSMPTAAQFSEALKRQGKARGA